VGEQFCFPFGKPPVPQPGFDAIIGQTNANPPVRELSGTFPANSNTELRLPREWVVPNGGEYFFSPSLPALMETFALAA
jgi:hypothetical protein